jgi:UDP-GlcNAc:undecaprenyl-phosphate GlcNAc-1-phosphate transferase
VPLLTTAFATPVAARVAHRFEILDHPTDSRFHTATTPYLGGVAVAAGLAIAALFISRFSVQLAVILGGGLCLMFVGLIDDRRGVQPSVKILAEIASATALWLAGVQGGLFGQGILDYAITVLWVLAITNSLNLIDNMDGLASGVTAIASLTYFVIAASDGDYLVASFALALAGASCGFLRHNFPPARIFLGDAGSLMLGFLLAALALKLDLVGEAGFVRGAVPVLILGVPIFDTILVIIARTRGRRPLSHGGTDHSSHRMTEIGLGGRSVALATYAAQIAMCGMALFIFSAGDDAALTSLIFCALMAVVLLVLFLMVEPKNGDSGVAENPRPT